MSSESVVQPFTSLFALKDSVAQWQHSILLPACFNFHTCLQIGPTTNRLGIKAPETRRIRPQPLLSLGFVSATRLCPLADHAMPSVAGRKGMVPRVSAGPTDKTAAMHHQEILSIASELCGLRLPSLTDHTIASELGAGLASLLCHSGRLNGIFVTTLTDVTRDFSYHTPSAVFWGIKMLAQ